jgi:hypothetical protein
VPRPEPEERVFRFRAVAYPQGMGSPSAAFAKALRLFLASAMDHAQRNLLPIWVLRRHLNFDGRSDYFPSDAVTRLPDLG